MTLTRREHILIALLPPLVLLALWGHLVGDNLRTRIETARTKLLGAPAGSVAPGTDPTADLEPRLEWTRSSCERLETELADARKRRDALAGARADLARRWSHAPYRASSVRALLQLMEDLGIAVQRSEALASASNFHPPEPLLDLSRRMQELGAEAPQLWRFDLIGGYGAMRDALQACTQLEQFDLPVSLSAQPCEVGRGRPDELAFTLWLWI